MDLALNNLQWLMRHKIKPNKTKPKPNMDDGTEDVLCDNILLYWGSYHVTSSITEV